MHSAPLFVNSLEINAKSLGVARVALLGMAFLIGACEKAPLEPQSVHPAVTRSAGVVVSGSRIVVFPSDILNSVDPAPKAHQFVRIDVRGAGSGTPNAGPDTPPLGTGSLHISTPAAIDKITLLNFDYAGVKLADFDGIAYETYRKPQSTATPAPLPGLNLQVDYLGDGKSFTTLVFEPYLNSDQGAIVAGRWQRWNAFKGGAAKWWSTRNVGSGFCGISCSKLSFNAFIAAFPNAKISAGVGINQGSGNGGLHAATDAFTLSVKGSVRTYDFEPNQPPIAAAGPDQTLFRTSPAGVEVTLDGTGSTDEGVMASYAWSENGSIIATGAKPTHTFGIGIHVVKLVVTDDGGATAEDFVTITVNNRPPVAFVANAVRTLECVNGGAVASLDATGSSDVDGTIVHYRWTSAAGDATGSSASKAFPLGTTVISLVVEDNDAATDDATATVTVADTEPPAIAMAVSPTELWPANSRMVRVAKGVSTTDGCDPAPALNVVVTSNEPENAPGDGNTPADWDVVGNQDGTYDVYVRAERSGSGSGRVYTITATAADANGNGRVRTGTVTVPRDRR